MTLQIGEVLKNRYRILQILATGGMGIVYRAKDESLGVDVAIKESIPGGISSESIQKIASLFAGLHHPGIPRITDTFELKKGSHLLVMDFIPGEDLKTHVEKNGPFKVGEAIRIISAVGSVLQYLHNQIPPIIHQDVKPGNIRITPDGKVMLVDFDLATTVQANQTHPITNEQGLTPGFAAPEQYNRMADTCSDQYGLAATLYYALTGLMLQDGITRASGNSQFPKIATSRIPLDVYTCLEKALQINPVDRYPDIQSFLDSLSSIVKTQPEISSTTRNQRYTKPQSRKNLIITIFASVIGLTMVGVAGLLLIKRPAAGITAPRKTSTPITSIPTTKSSNPPEAVHSNPTNTPTLLPTATEAVVKERKPTPLGGGTGEFVFVSEKTGIPQIFLGSISSQNVHQLTNIPEGACQPDWSPDGKRIIFISPCLPKAQVTGKAEPYSNSGLFIITIDGNQIIPLPSQPGGDFDPAWSPDGKQIVFTSLRNKFAQIYVTDLSSDKTEQLTNTTGVNRQPSWSPDGNFIAFSSNRGSSLQIYVMAVDGNDPKAFSILNNGAAFTADWAPDGKSIVYSQTNSLRLVLKKVGTANEDEKILNPRLSSASNPDISPDGFWILFDSNLGGKYQIYRITSEGNGAEPFTPPNENSYQPVWKPTNQDQTLSD